jgi:regulator of sirC expression with transglutaminase-like and TPR domain
VATASPQLKFPATEQAALSALLDDQSPRVRRSLLAHFEAHPAEARALLEALVAGHHRSLAWHARWFLEELRFSDPAAEFIGFIRSLAYELETGCLLMARTVWPATDFATCSERLDGLAARCRELLIEPATPRERCRVLNRVLFHEHGFRGNTEHYADPANSLLPVVLDRRRGLPLTLCVVYLLVAQRLGFALAPICTPGHFLLGYFEESEPFYVDCFEQGALRSPPEVFKWLRARGAEPTLADLAPAPVREVLARCCRNLAHHYAAAGDETHAQLFVGFVEEFARVESHPKN